MLNLTRTKIMAKTSVAKVPYKQKPGDGQLKYNMDKSRSGKKIGYGTFTQLDGEVINLVAWATDKDFVICNFSIDRAMSQAQAALAAENEMLKVELAAYRNKEGENKVVALKDEAPF